MAARLPIRKNESVRTSCPTSVSKFEVPNAPIRTGPNIKRTVTGIAWQIQKTERYARFFRFIGLNKAADEPPLLHVLLLQLQYINEDGSLPLA